MFATRIRFISIASRTSGRLNHDNVPRKLQELRAEPGDSSGWRVAAKGPSGPMQLVIDFVSLADVDFSVVQVIIDLAWGGG